MKQEIKPLAVYSTMDASEILGLHPLTIQKYCRDGRIKAIKAGRIYLIKGQALLDFVEGK